MHRRNTRSNTVFTDVLIRADPRGDQPADPVDLYQEHPTCVFYGRFRTSNLTRTIFRPFPSARPETDEQTAEMYMFDNFWDPLPPRVVTAAAVATPAPIVAPPALVVAPPSPLLLPVEPSGPVASVADKPRD